jgi:hypothetical protein
MVCNMTTSIWRGLVGSALAVVLGFATSASAATVTYNFTTDDWNGAPSPGGLPPYLKAVFTDVAGGVALDLTAYAGTGTGLLPGEFVASWYFNVLDRTTISGIAAGSDSDPSGTAFLKDGPEAQADFRADGDGYFDIRIDYDANAFTRGKDASFLFTGTGLTALSFIDLSAPGPGVSPGPFYAAAKIQGSPNNESGWISGGTVPVVITDPPPVPLPAAAWAGVALFGALGARSAVKRRRAIVV